MKVEGTIILPIAGRSSRFPGMRPKWMLAAPSGRLMLEMSLGSVPDWRSHRMVVGGLSEHLDGLQGRTAIRRALGEAPEIVAFDEPTRGPAETVAMMIGKAGITGPIFVKDCDSWFAPQPGLFDDLVCVADLRKLRRVRNVAGKSFVTMNEQHMVTGIAEKSVTSNYVSVGGYGFHNASIFLDSYRVLSEDKFAGEPFISHVMLEAMRRGVAYRALEVEGYEDVGTLSAWNDFRNRLRTYFVDIDGVVLKNAGEYLPPFWDDPDAPLEGNAEALRRLAADGAQLVFVTARPERYREKTEAALAALGLSWHAIVFGINHSGRVLVNDYAPTNPYPAAIAINLGRNDDKLASMIGGEE